MDLNKKKLAEDIKKLVPEASTINVNFGKKRIPLPPNIMVFQTFAFLAATELKPATNKVLMLFFFISSTLKRLIESLSNDNIQMQFWLYITIRLYLC